MEKHLEIEAEALMPDLSNYYVVQYHHIDDYRCFQPLSETFAVPSYYETNAEKSQRLEKELKDKLAKLFADSGWEGDGTIDCIFIPPRFIPSSDTYCTAVFHVKQSNNGTSFLAIPNNLKLELPKDF